MANWQRTLDIKDAWEKTEKNEITVQQLAAVIAEKLGDLMPYGNLLIEDGRRDLIGEFKNFADDDSCDDNDFDELMEALYDWGDLSLGGRFPNVKKACWIKAQF